MSTSTAEMTFEEAFRQGVFQGQPVVEFTRQQLKQFGVDDLEGYAEAGMRTRILRAEDRRDDIIRLHVDYAPFDAYNQALESANYFNADHQPVLNARQAGFYRAQDTIDVPGSLKVGHLMALQAGPGLVLQERWHASNHQGTYVAFLEEELVRLDPSLQPSVPSRGPKP